MLHSHLRTLRTRRRAALQITTVAAIALIAAMAAGCSSSASSAGRGSGEQAPAGPVTAATAAPSAAPSAAGARDLAGGGSPSGGQAGVDTTGPLIIRTGSLQLEVRDLDASLLQARARIVGLGGYVSDSERTNDGERSVALITYRIPASRWDEALDDLHGLATRVVAEQTKAVEVTGEVLDLGARIENLRATERALQAIMAQATKISDILDVQNQLTGVRGQIEQLSTQKAHISDQAALGTLAVTYGLPIVAVNQVSSGWNLSTEFDRAAAQLVQIGQGLAVAAVWLGVVGLPILFAILLIAAVLVYVARRLNPARAAASADPAVPVANG